jgi:hypothetical protein
MVYAVLSSNQEQGFGFDEWECEYEEIVSSTTAPSSTSVPEANSKPISQSVGATPKSTQSNQTLTDPTASTDSAAGIKILPTVSSSSLASNAIICFSELERQLILDLSVIGLFEFLKEKSVFEKSQNILIVAEALLASGVNGLYLLDLRSEEIDGFGMDIGPTKTLKNLLITNEKRKRDKEDAELIEISLDY